MLFGGVLSVWDRTTSPSILAGAGPPFRVKHAPRSRPSHLGSSSHAPGLDSAATYRRWGRRRPRFCFSDCALGYGRAPWYPCLQHASVY